MDRQKDVGENTSQVTKKQIWISFAGGCILGTIIFILVYGYCVLDVTYDAFIINEGTDLPGFQIVWDAYRYSGFSDGNGLTIFNTLTYPNYVTWVLQDEVPILAVVLKCFSFLLPSKFQYVGIWGLLCFTLQGGLASLILCKFTKNSFWASICSIPLILAPPVLAKLFFHHAEAGQWVLLVAIASWIYVDYFKTNRGRIIIWIAIGILTAGVNIYYLPMVGIILLGEIACLEFNNLKNFNLCIKMLGAYLFGAIFWIGIMQGFNLNYTANSDFYLINIDRLRRCGANLNTFFNATGLLVYWGKYLEWAKDGQGEGIAYLGAGMIIALIFAIAVKIGETICRCKVDDKISNDKEDIIGDDISSKKGYMVGAVTIFILSLIVGMGPTVSINGHVICEIPYPNIILKLWSNFRSTGRIIWPAYYILMITIFKVIIDWFYKVNRKNILYSFLTLVIVVQIMDLYPFLNAKHQIWGHYQELNTTVIDQDWDYFANNYKHMVVLPDSIIIESADRHYLAKYARDNQLTLNNYYMARQDKTDHTSEWLSKIKQGKIDNDTFFVLSCDKIEEFLDVGLYIYILDGFAVGTIKDVSKNIQKNAVSYDIWKLKDNYTDGYIYDGLDYQYVFNPIYYYYTRDEFYQHKFEADEIWRYFKKEGIQRGDQADAKFNPRKYKNCNEDVRNEFGDEWKNYYKHFIENGRNENRVA